MRYDVDSWHTSSFKVTANPLCKGTLSDWAKGREHILHTRDFRRTVRWMNKVIIIRGPQSRTLKIVKCMHIYIIIRTYSSISNPSISPWNSVSSSVSCITIKTYIIRCFLNDIVCVCSQNEKKYGSYISYGLYHFFKYAKCLFLRLHGILSSVFKSKCMD